jgi:hypothetical protein
VSELPDLRELRSGATGMPLHADGGGELGELHRQRRQRTLEDTTPLARDTAMAYREVMGDRREREQAADSASRQPRGSTYL